MVGLARRADPESAAGRLYLWTAGRIGIRDLLHWRLRNWKVVTGYRDHRDALAIFGRDVRPRSRGPSLAL